MAGVIWKRCLNKAFCVPSGFGRVLLFVTLWTVACQAPLSVGFSRQEYCSGLPYLPPWDLLTEGLNPCLLCLLYWQVGSLPLVPSLKPTCPIYFSLFSYIHLSLQSGKIPFVPSSEQTTVILNCMPLF